MGEIEVPTGQGVYMTGNFEIEEKIGQETKWDRDARTYVTNISCSGANRLKKLIYEIRATGYSSSEYILEERTVYFLRGSFFPSNTLFTTKDVIHFEATHRAPVISADDMKESLMDTVGVSGCGIIIGLDIITEECMDYLEENPKITDLTTTVVTIQHGDYHPVDKAKAFRMEYRLRPFLHLAGIRKILKTRREVNVHGFIQDFNPNTECWIVVVNKISFTTGSQNANNSYKGRRAPPKAPKGAFSKPTKYVAPVEENEDVAESEDEEKPELNETGTNMSSGSSYNNMKPPKYSPSQQAKFTTNPSLSAYIPTRGLQSGFKSPFPDHYSGTNSSLPFPPADYDPSSYLPASTMDDTSPPKKKARAAPKKRATRGKMLDLTQGKSSIAIGVVIR
ncbi:uncharacterized protein MELLADRAFT_94914 [Melampsora larici-populina 98AG31]|uniref:Uncharacterized protein n=1 Tax=Melampsora larici-populina (strain 98AG31 / pathotype 3-4-7) TaxID=747676 RepID=F4S8E3_MELLP|nr:uncharacterized protein MELLADRAFT_94914 [Melampsora larici-populina 98AG31]EGF99083.1 hypothetical protein MELLADRAFT_94914 [Melampsora larici-populina 98AG31]